MIVSWQWLKKYVALEMPLAELEQRLTMAGLNHEGTMAIDSDFAVDLEVTSNRPDCLGHLGVAREIAVLYGQPLEIPTANPVESSSPVDSLTSVVVECPELCPRYSARVIQGVKVGPSPDWLVRHLKTVYQSRMKKGETWKPINNIVDISNFVLMECGQPLHTFDFAKLKGQRIVVRQASENEQFEAIDHRTYSLDKRMCVIADAERPVALGGVMGGADTEVSDATTDLLIESALFDPISIRTTARKLVLHSDSSYRFERGPDPAGIDWASRRCCELILEIAGGQLAAGSVDVGVQPAERPAVRLRLGQLERILGITINRDEVTRILTALGNETQGEEQASVTVVPPGWRQDLQREIDLVEEVARIHGYDKIPEDSQVPMTVSSRRLDDRVESRIRRALTAAGFDEAMTPSVVDEIASAMFSPWSKLDPISCDTPLLRGATRLRRSLVPSLLAARQTNASLSNQWIELFEIATVYLPGTKSLPTEEKMVSLTSGRDFIELKGAIELVLASLNPEYSLQLDDFDCELFEVGRGCELHYGDELLGYMGVVSKSVLKSFGLREDSVVAEMRIATLVKHANLFPQNQPLSAYPVVERDLNFEVDEALRWSQLAGTVHNVVGENLEAVEYLETYRDQQRLGSGKKSLVLKVVLRKSNGTLTGAEADQVRTDIEAACKAEHGAVLRT
ncbi:MAG: phenylalanine--tRNA ligase subunit beta [Planctomycetales bacterium]